MNLTALLNYESMKYHGAQTQATEVNQFVANALRVFIVDFYQRVAPAFIVIISCRRPSPMNFYRTIMQLLYESVDNMIIQLVHYNHTTPERIDGPRLHNLILVDSLEALLDVEIHTFTERNDTNEYYYIFLQQRDARIPVDMQGIFEYCWRHQLINCNIQIQNARGEVTMHTYFPYTATHCAHVTPVRINQFMGQAWKQRVYFPSKLHNFHRCPLKVAVRNESPFMTVTSKTQQTDSYHMTGIEGQMLLELVVRLNFTLKLLMQNQNAGTENHMHTMLEEQTAQLAVGYMRQRAELNKKLSAAFPHYASTLVGCVLLSAHNLTSFQLLSFPFQPVSWLGLLAVTICVSLVLLFNVSFEQTIKVKRIRRHVDRCAFILSVYAVALGMPSVTTPPTRLPRQLLFASWLCYTLLVRAMYSALVYYLVRHPVHQRLPTTIMGLLRNDFTVIMNRASVKDLMLVPYFEKFNAISNVVIDSADEFSVMQYLKQYQRDHFFAVVSHDVLIDYVWRQRTPGMFYIIPEYVVQQQVAIYLQKHSFIVHQLDELIMSLQAVGLLEYWSRSVVRDKYFSSTYLYRENLLGETQLMAIFVVMACLHLTAIFVFVCELLAKRWSP